MTCDGLEVLRELPLLEPNKLQREMLGPEDTTLTLAAQRRARKVALDMSLCPDEDFPVASFPSSSADQRDEVKDEKHTDSAFATWTPAYLAEESLSASAWERKVIRDSFSGVQMHGNHKCRKNVCMKKCQKKKKAFCRFRFWRLKPGHKNNSKCYFRVAGRPLQEAISKNSNLLCPVFL